jgi:hypothetical protein
MKNAIHPNIPVYKKSKIAPTIFMGAIIVLICFFLPWMEVSCEGNQASFAGVKIAQKYPSLWLVPLTMAGIILSFYRLKRKLREQDQQTAYIGFAINSFLLSLGALGIIIERGVYMYQQFYLPEYRLLIRPQYGLYTTMGVIVLINLGSLVMKLYAQNNAYYDGVADKYNTFLQENLRACYPQELQDAMQLVYQGQYQVALENIERYLTKNPADIKAYEIKIRILKSLQRHAAMPSRGKMAVIHQTLQ